MLVLENGAAGFPLPVLPKTDVPAPLKGDVTAGPAPKTEDCVEVPPPNKEEETVAVPNADVAAEPMPNVTDVVDPQKAGGDDDVAALNGDALVAVLIPKTDALVADDAPPKTGSFSFASSVTGELPTAGDPKSADVTAPVSPKMADPAVLEETPVNRDEAEADVAEPPPNNEGVPSGDVAVAEMSFTTGT